MKRRCISLAVTTCSIAASGSKCDAFVSHQGYAGAGHYIRLHHPRTEAVREVKTPLFLYTQDGDEKACADETTSTDTSTSRFLDNDIAARIRHDLATVTTSLTLFTAALAFPANQQAQAMLNENQQFVSDVWWAVTTQYFDQSFNGLGEEGWRAKKREAIEAVAASGPEDEKEVADAITAMLSALNDPYTRFLPREKFESLTAYATGRTGSAGIGVQLLLNPRTNLVQVMAATTGGPAQAAGIKPGDAIISIDGEIMEGASAEVVAAKCRGESGGKVELEVRSEEDGKAKRMTLTRASVNANAPLTSTFTSESGNKIGVLKLPSFSTETATQIVQSVRSMYPVDAIAIDLRGNVGGYMPAGVDAAKLFLPPRAHIIAEVNKAGQIKAYDADGIGAETSTPVYLLVDGRTASAAEIFAAALQDNRRALVVGSTKTFGKGRIQNVQPLENGTGVAVTKARYVTPRGRDLHGKGIEPNKVPNRCEAEDTAVTCLEGIV